MFSRQSTKKLKLLGSLYQCSEGGGLGVPHRLEKGTNASEDVGPRRRVDCEIPHRMERERNILYKGVETSP